MGIIRVPGLNVFVVLVAVTAACTTNNDSNHEPAVPAAAVSVPGDAAQRLAGSIRIATVSHADSAAFDSSAFIALHEYLRQNFPRTHATLHRETVSDFSLLYKWTGSNAALMPVLLAGHLDVVPVEPGTEESWEHGAFSGDISDGFVWGRGAIDNKSTVAGVLEAIELLLREGFVPERTVYIAFGHDEEVGGTRGAQRIANLLRERGVELGMVLDEGGVVGDGIMPGIEARTALVGIAEKGFASIELIARGEGGHSSLPPRQTAIGILSAAVTRLEANPMPARLRGATMQMFDQISPRFPALQRFMFANLWLTRPIVLRKLEGSPTTNAMVRTTNAVTIFQAGTKENVLPRQARAVVNFRILPGDSIKDVLAHVRKVVDDPRVAVRIAPGFTAEPSALTATSSRSFTTVDRTIRSLDPAIVVAPYLVVVVTDSRFYAPLTSNVLRFLPVRLAPADLGRMHGINERIAVRDYEWAIRFYRQLIVNATAA